MMNEIYLGNTPVRFITQDRIAAAKEAVKALSTQTNLDGQPAKVKFGLARYHTQRRTAATSSFAPALDNKAALFAAIDAASGRRLHAAQRDARRRRPLLRGRGPARLLHAVLARPLGWNGRRRARQPDHERLREELRDRRDGRPADAGLQQPPRHRVHELDRNYDGVGRRRSGRTVPGDRSTPARPPGSTTSRSTSTTTICGPTMIGLQNVFTYTVGFNVDASLLAERRRPGPRTLLQHVDRHRPLGPPDRGGRGDHPAQHVVLVGDRAVHAARPSVTASTPPTSCLAGTRASGAAISRPTSSRRRSTCSTPAERVALDPITNEFIEPRNPYWDAADTVLSSYASRTIYTTRSGSRELFTASDPDNAAQLGVTFAEESLFPHFAPNPGLIEPSGTAPVDEPLGDAIVNFVHGFDAFDEDATISTSRIRVRASSATCSTRTRSRSVRRCRSCASRRATARRPTASSFMGRFGQRHRVLYVGANDGMMHGIAAGSFQDPNPTCRATSTTRRATGASSSATSPASSSPASSACRSRTPASSTSSTAAAPRPTSSSTTTETASARARSGRRRCSSRCARAARASWRSTSPIRTRSRATTGRTRG